jgi:cell division septal protein FtsQ
MTSAALSAAGRLVPRIASPLGAHWRRRLVLIALLALALTAAYMLWFRDSSFVRVERVEVVGLAIAPNAAEIRAELTSAAERMTTLNLDRAALERIAARSPVVHAIEVRPDFPHDLTIRVVENKPVALLATDEGRLPVAADGTVLEGIEAQGALPEVRTVAAVPSSGRLAAGGALDRVEVAAAAPAELRAKVTAITIQPDRGYVAELQDGPEVWLGGHDRLAEKWDAVAAILAAESSAGAEYVDVRIPERGAAGGLAIEPPAEEPIEEPVDPAAAAPTAPEPPVADPATEAVPEAAAPPVAPTEIAPETAPVDPQPGVEP